MHAFVTKPAAPNTAANGSAAAPGPQLGSLAKRPAALKRAEGDLFSVLDRYLDNSISTSDKRSRVTEERDLLAMMETMTKEVLGRPKANSRDEIKPSLSTTLALRKAEVQKWVTVTDKVQLYAEKGDARFVQFKLEIWGTTSIRKLNMRPDVLGKGGVIGKIVEWLEHMRTWLSEESHPTRIGGDICQDRLTFAAKVNMHLKMSNTCPRLRALRSMPRLIDSIIVSRLVHKRQSRSLPSCATSTLPLRFRRTRSCGTPCVTTSATSS